MMDLGILVTIAIIGVLLGFLLGFVVRALTHRKTESKAEATPKAGRGSAQKPQKPGRSKKASRRDRIEIANLWRDQRDGRLIFQIEDQTYKRGDELTPREREILLKVVMDFYRWLEPTSKIPERSKTPDKTEAAVEPELLPPEMRMSASQQETSSSIESITPSNVINRVLQSEVPAPPPPEPSIVNQIDIILQEKLQTANMQKWAVRLMESPTKSMIVFVGLEQYESLDEVPYERVRKIIRSSVAEWERSEGMSS